MWFYVYSLKAVPDVKMRARHCWQKQVPKRIYLTRHWTYIPLVMQMGIQLRRQMIFGHHLALFFYLFRGASEFCTSPNCDVTRQQQCVQIVKRYNSKPNVPEEAVVRGEPNEEYQILRHVVLLLILSCSMFVVRGISTTNYLYDWPIVFARVSLSACGPSL